MARVLSSVSHEPPILRWLHALDPERNVDSVLLRSSLRYSCTFPQGHARPPWAAETTSSIFIPMYVRAPFILGQSHSPSSPNDHALGVLCAPNPPPQTRSRRFVVDLSSTKPIEFVEYEWMVDGKLCVSLHEISEDGLYNGQTIIFDGPPAAGSQVPSKVAMRLHYKESPLPGSGKQSLEAGWRDKPNSWEVWGGIFARLRSGKMSICTKYAVSSTGGPQQRGEFFVKLSETCVIGETGNGNTNSMSNRLIRLFLQKNGMMTAHPSQDENIARKADQRMLTDTITALDDEDSPMFSAPTLELQNGLEHANGNGNSDIENGNNTAIQIDIADQYMMNPQPMDVPEIIQEEMAVGGGNQPQQPHDNIIVPSLEHSQSTLTMNGNGNGISASEGPYIPPPQELLPPPEPVYAPIPSRPLSSFSMPASETNSGSMSLSLPAPGHSKAASMSMSVRSTDTATIPQPPQMAENSNQLQLADLLSDEVSPLATQSTSNMNPSMEVNPHINHTQSFRTAAENQGTSSLPLFQQQQHEHEHREHEENNGDNDINNSMSSPSLQSFPSGAGSQAATPLLYQQQRQHEAPVIFPSNNSNVNVHSNNMSSGNAIGNSNGASDTNGIAVRAASPTNSHSVQLLGAHPLLRPLLAPDVNGNSDANGYDNKIGNSNVNANISPMSSTSSPMRIVPEPIVVPLPSATAARSSADPAASSLSRLSLTQRATITPADKQAAKPPDASKGITKKQKTRAKATAARGHHLCTLCGQKFSHTGHFNAHMKAVHQKIRNHKCTYPGCERPFAKRSDLLRHQLSQHSQDVRYPCSECAIIFPTKVDLGQHFSQVHDKDRPYKCKDCPKTYSTRSGLRKHQHAKHGKNKMKNENGIMQDEDNDSDGFGDGNALATNTATRPSTSAASTRNPPASAVAVPIAG